MTRETKIGLLVGLVFIFAFGLILGYRNQQADPQLALGGQNIPVYNQPSTSALELTALRGSPIRLNTNPAPQGTDTASHQPRETMTTMPESWSRSPSATGIPDAEVLPTTHERLEELMNSAPPAEPSPAAGGQKYVVAKGDTLSKIARKFYGSAIQAGANEYLLGKKIFEANRDKMADENSLKLGQELVIPAVGTAPAARQPASGVQVVDEQQLQEIFQRQPAGSRPSGTATAARQTYTTQRGDSLTSIARKQMNTASRQAVQKLFEANKDKLRSINDVPIGVTLVIPG